jgi:ribosomal 50S subunit-recycling heat shock protein
LRLDNYLTKSRLIKRRSLAKAACDRGIVSVDGRVAKASKEIFAGQRITIDFASRILEAEVLRIPGGNISRKDSRDLYRILKEIRKEEEYL